MNSLTIALIIFIAVVSQAATIFIVYKITRKRLIEKDKLQENNE